MKKQSKKSGSSNMLLLAGLGIGAALLLAGTAKGSNKNTSDNANQDEPAEIPDVPKILAVNKSATESPVPTAMVSDEADMQPTAAVDSAGNSADEDAGDNSEAIPASEGNSAISKTMVVRKTNASKTASIPPLVTTTLTPKEKAIISKGVLTDDLALQRPDLYKAIYVKKYGKSGNGRKALIAANTAVSKIQMAHTIKATPTQKKRRKVWLKLHPKTAVMVQTAKKLSANRSTASNSHAQKPKAGTPVRPARLKHPAHPAVATPKRPAATHKKTVRKKT